MKIRALIAEDEPLARRKLRRLLSDFEDVEIVGETTEGGDTVRAIDRLEPELVFLDIQLPGATGLQVLAKTEHRPHVIFTTAYDRYAVAAFELHAIDYLMKPFGEERLAVAVERARDRIGRLSTPRTHERVARALASSMPLQRLFVRTRGEIVPVPTESIEHFEGEGDYVRLHTGQKEYLVHVRLKDLEARLDADRFLRVHKSHIVNLDRVQALTPHSSSRYLITLRSGRQVLASRGRSRRLRELIL
jgi:two-component system LytT family response regulator